jgi:hypothetical protein
VQFFERSQPARVQPAVSEERVAVH